MTDTPARPAGSGTADQRSRPLPVLVVGAGPVGLTVAAELLRRGVDVRLVDRADTASARSRALLVWPRTLDVLRGLGGRAAIEAGSLPIESLRYYSSGRLVTRIGFDTRTRPVVLPQPEVESLLTEAVTRAGGEVEHGTALVGLTQTQEGVRVGLERAGVTSYHDVGYVVGCDGAGSTVRDALGVAFDGETYPLTFMLSDTRVDGPLRPDVAHYFCSPRGVLVMIGMPGGRFRVFTSAPPGPLPDARAMPGVIQEMVDQRGPGGLRLYDRDWTSTFAVHARYANRFRTGRVFLAGDAAHIHSPAGGQGLNTGVTDAHNLAWKLALAWHGHAGEALLASYDSERRETAAGVVRQADLQTKAWLITKPWQVALRDTAARAASAARLLDRDFVPSLTGLRTSYRHGAVVPDGSRRPGRTGERCFVPGSLPPVRLAADALGDGTHHTLLVVPRLRDAAPVAATGLLPAVCRAARGDLLRLRTLDAAGRPGTELRGDEAVTALSSVPAACLLVLVRPDGHIAAVGQPDATNDLTGYLKRYLRPDKP